MKYYFVHMSQPVRDKLHCKTPDRYLLASMQLYNFNVHIPIPLV